MKSSIIRVDSQTYPGGVSLYRHPKCHHDSCENIARYKGYCFKHWKCHVKEETMTVVTDEQFTMVCANSPTNQAVATAFGISRNSVVRRCKKLGIQIPSQRVPFYSVPMSGPVSSETVKTVSNYTEDERMERALADVVRALRTIPDCVERERIARAAIALVGPSPLHENGSIMHHPI